MLQILRKRRVVAITVFLSMLSIAVALLLLLPRRYEASMEYLISNERVNSPVGPDKNTQAIFYLDEVGEARINTEVALLTSNDLLTQVVDEAHLETSVSPGHLNGVSRKEAALKLFKRDLVVSPLKKANIIEVRYQSTDPKRASEVLRILSRLYLDSHLRLRGTNGSAAFFESVWKEYSDKRGEAEKALAEYKAAHSIVSLPEEKALALQREADLEKQYAEARAAANRSSSQASELDSLVSTTPASILGERKSLPNQAELQQLHTALLGLQNKRVEAASRYLPEDRFVKDLDQQIAQTRAALATATSTHSEEVSTIANPVLSNAQSELLHAQDEKVGDEARAATIGSQMFRNRKRLADLDEQTSTYTLLTDNVARLTELDRDYRQKADAAKVSLMLDEKHISDVAVAESPFASSEPTSPKTTAIAIVGFVWAIVAALGSAFLVDYAKVRVRSPYEVQRVLGAPILAYVRIDEQFTPPTASLPEGHAAQINRSDSSIWRIA